MTKTYDRDSAPRLVPLLEAIFREVAERRHEVRLLEKTLARMSSEDTDQDEIARVRASLAIHRRELRLARKEFELLGCVIDESNPNRVFIPGPKGLKGARFEWQAGDETVSQAPTDLTVG